MDEQDPTLTGDWPPVSPPVAPLTAASAVAAAGPGAGGVLDWLPVLTGAGGNVLLLALIYALLARRMITKGEHEAALAREREEAARLREANRRLEAERDEQVATLAAENQWYRQQLWAGLRRESGVYDELGVGRPGPNSLPGPGGGPGAATARRRREGGP